MQITQFCLTHFLTAELDSISGKCLHVVILTVILSSEYFGGDVIGGTAESARRIARSQALLKEKNKRKKDHQL